MWSEVKKTKQENWAIFPPEKEKLRGRLCQTRGQLGEGQSR